MVRFCKSLLQAAWKIYSYEMRLRKHDIKSKYSRYIYFTSASINRWICHKYRVKKNVFSWTVGSIIWNTKEMKERISVSFALVWHKKQLIIESVIYIAHLHLNIRKSAWKLQTKTRKETKQFGNHRLSHAQIIIESSIDILIETYLKLQVAIRI
jgi:hypothetical protein